MLYCVRKVTKRRELRKQQTEIYFHCIHQKHRDLCTEFSFQDNNENRTLTVETLYAHKHTHMGNRPSKGVRG